MKRMDLSGNWQLTCPLGQGAVQVPGDYYSDLLALGLIDDPYVGENAESLKAIELTPTYTRTFTYTPGEVARRAVVRFHGVDTLAEIFLNGVSLGETDNMHCCWSFDVLPLLNVGENTLAVTFRDPRVTFAEHHARRPLRGADDSIDGFQSVRKAFYQSGWDFAPEVVNVGLFRPVELVLMEEASLEGVTLRQTTTQDKAEITVLTRVDATHTDAVTLAVTVTDPDGAVVATAREPFAVAGEQTGCTLTLWVDKPQLWYPNGLGSQPLYTVTTTLLVDGKAVDSDTKTLGLRSLVFSSARDDRGRDFTFTINGVTPYIKGANYIPEDCLPSRRSRERTARLLEDCAACHFNMIRVWGGGFYPDDWFYDLCDRLGLLVWQDVMFACCFVENDPDLFAATKRELRHNLWRFSHHSCLALLCGNNEIEEALDCWGTWCDVADEETRQTYLDLFESVIPKELEQAMVDVAYIPSSPTSGGGINQPGSRASMDCHDWRVFHGHQPYEVYREDHCRFLSEFGFESFPSVKTLESRMPQPLAVDTVAMEYRNRCHWGNTYLMECTGDYYRVPEDFRMKVYLTQRLQSDSVKYAIDHMRRHRHLSRGSLYWQINDCWPGISWASIDYDGRWKPLQYAAKEFYAPVALILSEDKGKVTLSVSNETMTVFAGRVEWQLLKNDLTPLQTGSYSVAAEGFTAVDIATLDFSHLTEEDRRQCVVVASLLDAKDKAVGQQVARFVYAKDFVYLPAGITARLDQQEGVYTLTLQAENFAQDVWLEFGHTDCVFSRNGFSLTGQPVTVTLSRIEGETPRIEDLQILCLNDTLY